MISGRVSIHVAGACDGNSQGSKQNSVLSPYNHNTLTANHFAMWSFGVGTSLTAVVIVALLTGVTSAAGAENPADHDVPSWEELDARPLPAWYDQAKFGIFIHWGVFSVPSFGSEWFWHYWQSGNPKYVNFMKQNYPPDFTYADFAPQFTAEFYDPDQWADIFQASGAKYVVLTSKHHEGFCNWATNHSFNWNSMAVGPKKDLVGELAASIRKKTDLRFGVYHSLFEWFNPMYLEDSKNNYSTNNFVKYKTMPELYELVEKYHPELVWSDGDAGPDTYWGSREFLGWLYNKSPVRDTVVTNDRWCTNGCSCHHGGYYTCSDRYNPGKLQPHKWENCMTIDKASWGYRRDAQLSDYLTPLQLLTTLAETVSCGGNLLMNVGPTHDGRIMPMFEERLRQVGSWLNVNGEAIYSSQPWYYQNDTMTKDVWYTWKNDESNGDAVYAITLFWPANRLYLGAPWRAPSQVKMLGHTPSLKWKMGDTGGITIDMPDIPANELPCKWAWVFKLVYPY